MRHYVFLALRIRFRILKMLKEHNLMGKVSVNDVIFELPKMERTLEKSGTEYFVALPKKVERMFDLYKDKITIG